MKISTKYNVNDEVEILPIDLKGRIVSINVDRSGLQYRVRYFKDAEIHYEYFTEDELTSKSDSEGFGFNGSKS